MSEKSSDQANVERCRAGDQQAAERIYDQYVQRLIGLAQKRLNRQVAARVDAEDIVQSVFRSFFGRLQKGQFEVKDDDDVWRLLACITVHKTLKQVEFHRRARRNAAREVGAGDDRHWLVNHLSAEPTPEDAALFMDELEHFLEQLRPEDRQIIELRLDGYSNTEIADKLQISDRKIRRLMERMRGLAEKDHPLH